MPAALIVTVATVVFVVLRWACERLDVAEYGRLIEAGSGSATTECVPGQHRSERVGHVQRLTGGS